MTRLEVKMLEKALSAWLRELRRTIKKNKELPQYEDDDDEEED
jgi:hypothetical protein